MAKKSRKEMIKIRHARIRKKIRGTIERPRLCFTKTNRHLYAQIINDDEGKTLIFVTTNTKDFKSKFSSKNFSNKECAKLIGEVIAKKALEKNIEKVVFDRGGHLYHGVVAEFADAARKAGLKF